MRAVHEDLPAYLGSLAPTDLLAACRKHGINLWVDNKNGPDRVTLWYTYDPVSIEQQKGIEVTYDGAALERVLLASAQPLMVLLAHEKDPDSPAGTHSSHLH